MYLLIGHTQDSCCQAVRDALESRGCQARIVANPLARPWRVTYRVGSAATEHSSRASEDEQLEIQLDGVLVRGGGEVGEGDWRPNDLLYMQAELRAAMLGWLWRLPCPVVNRYPAWLWHRPRPPLPFWWASLMRSGLRPAELLVSNLESEARNFGRHGAGGAVYAPLTTGDRYLIGSEEDWNGLAAMQRVAPVTLAQPHGAAHLACVVGGGVVWQGAPPASVHTLEPKLRHFAADVGLSFVQVVLAEAPGGLSVVAVEPQPRFDQFGPAARQEITERLVRLLTAETRQTNAAAGSGGAQ